MEDAFEQSNRNDFVLVVAWLLASLRGRGPYPLLAISGEQGSAKTVLSKMFKALVDPNVASVRALPREERELMIAANNGYLLAFDNLSGLPAWMSDALCRLASGGSFAVRQLYTDDDEVLFQAARPLLVNGIEDIVSRADLADRGIFLTLQPISEHSRRSENELWRELWATACETALWPAGHVARAYAANRRAAIESIIEADPVAMCVQALMIDRTTWTGSASDLLSLCAEHVRADVSSGTSWTKNPRVLAGRLRRAQTFLRTLGIEITFSREGRTGTRMIRLSTSAENSVSTVSTVSAARSNGSRGDQAILPEVGE